MAGTPQTFNSDMLLAPESYRRARLARDARFDGLFYIAVKTTGIFCRPICPVVPPVEANVVYFEHASQALQAGFRPCLRCRPDSAPGSCAWRGTDTTFTRALGLIEEGALQTGSLTELVDRLGISERYLRQLFQQYLGLSPKAYALFNQVMFAKKLLHETALPVTQIAAVAGFNSVRRFNDAFAKQLQLAPTAIRRQRRPSTAIKLSLAYRPPLNWAAMLGYWRNRCLSGVEWVSDESYGRTFTVSDLHSGLAATGSFTVTPVAGSHTLQLAVKIDQPVLLKRLVIRVRQILDLDANIALIEQQFAQVPGFAGAITSGLRIPGIWHPFEAGVRAIVGQQVSVAAARTHLERLVAGLARPLAKELCSDGLSVLFPSPQAIAMSDLAMLKMPQSRRDTLRRFAHWYGEQGGASQPVTHWLTLKGIGPWTVDYVQMRAMGHTDIWLAGDLGVKKALAKLLLANAAAKQDANTRSMMENTFDSDQLKPWRSYATFQLWHMPLSPLTC